MEFLFKNILLAFSASWAFPFDVGIANARSHPSTWASSTSALSQLGLDDES